MSRFDIGDVVKIKKSGFTSEISHAISFEKNIHYVLQNGDHVLGSEITLVCKYSDRKDNVIESLTYH